MDDLLVSTSRNDMVSCVPVFLFSSVPVFPFVPVSQCSSFRVFLCSCVPVFLCYDFQFSFFTVLLSSSTYGSILITYTNAMQSFHAEALGYHSNPLSYIYIYIYIQCNVLYVRYYSFHVTYDGAHMIYYI